MQGIKDLMEGMNDKEALIHICNTNHEQLLLELEKLVVRNIFLQHDAMCKRRLCCRPVSVCPSVTLVSTRLRLKIL